MSDKTSRIKSQFLEAKEVLDIFLNNEANFDQIGRAGDIMVNSLRSGGKIISCGNGGSMCDAMHFAEELTGRFRDDRKPLAAISVSDPSYLSCVGNDYGFPDVFSRFVQGIGRKGDVLLAISTSGNSENVLRAIHAAKNMGISTVGLTGKDGGKMKGLCEVEICAPQTRYADRSQEIHIKIIHAFIQYIEDHLT